MKKTFLYIVVLLAGFSACKPLSEVNENPNDPTSAHPSQLLTYVSQHVFNGNRTSYNPSLSSRQLVNTESNTAAQSFTWQRGGFGDYHYIMQLQKMIEEAQKLQEGDNYIAVAKILRAYYFFELTRTFTDVPYSEAVKGESDGIFNPNYDTQKEVMEGIFTDLQEASSLLDANNTIGGDIVFEGDAGKWKQFANSLAMKFLINLSKREGEMSFNISEEFKKVYETGEFFNMLDAAANLRYVDALNSRYFLYQNNGIATDTWMEKTMVEFYKERSDERLFSIAAMTTNAELEGKEMNDWDAYEGVDGSMAFGDIRNEVNTGDVSSINPRYFSNPVNEPYMILGYSEMMFILAEAAYRGWIDNNLTASFYNKGTIGSLQFYGVSEEKIEMYMQHPKVVYQSKNGLEMIMNQKKAALIIQGGYELFYNYLRTGYPEITIGEGTGNNGKIPYRWMYPQSEVLNNSSAIDALDYNDDVNHIPWIWK